jgi:dephospho-CoA kinase
MKIIGITGPSGSGKTSVLEYLEQKGAKAINADRVYHELLKNSKSMRDAIMARFGILDTKELGKLVFADKSAMRDLENITHPFVVDMVKSQINGFNGNDIVVIEAIALLESPLVNLCGSVILITADYDKLAERITKRDGVSREYAEARLKNREFSCNTAFIIYNNDDLASLYSQLDKIYAEVISNEK